MTQETMNQQDTNALVAQGIPMTGIITKDQATAILTTVWKDAPKIEVFKAAMLCQDFGLHPLMKHVFLVKYDKYEGRGNDKKKVGEDWVTILGIGATRLIMSRLGSFGYTDDTPRIMSEEEQIKVFGKVDNDNVIAITRLKTKDGLEAPGYGKYPKTGGYLMGQDKGNSRENMAFIRSERNAFGRLFPDANMPKPTIEVMDEKYISTPSGLAELATGEIIDEIPVPVEEPEPQPEPDPEPEVTETKEEPEMVKDESRVTSKQVTELMALMEKAGKTASDMGVMMSKELKWKVPGKFGELQKWQMTELMRILTEAVG